MTSLVIFVLCVGCLGLGYGIAWHLAWRKSADEINRLGVKLDHLEDRVREIEVARNRSV